MTDYCYPKAKRLLKPTEFKQVFNQPLLKVHQTHLMAFAYPSGHAQARLGMAITKKKIPTAVARNRVKRLIREQFRVSHGQLPALDLVVIVKKSPSALSNAQLTQEIQNLLRKIVDKHKVAQKKHTKKPAQVQ